MQRTCNARIYLKPPKLGEIGTGSVGGGGRLVQTVKGGGLNCYIM